MYIPIPMHFRQATVKRTQLKRSEKHATFPAQGWILGSNERKQRKGIRERVMWMHCVKLCMSGTLNSFLFLVGEAQDAFDGVEMALVVFSICQEIVDGGFQELERHFRVHTSS